MHRPQQVSAHSEEILHHAVDRREALQMDGRLEATHLVFPLSRWLVRDLGAVVRILIRAVDHRPHHATARRRVAAKLVGDQSTRDRALAFQQLPEESHRGHDDFDAIARGYRARRHPRLPPARGSAGGR